jgi:hypothetical protein
VYQYLDIQSRFALAKHQYLNRNGHDEHGTAGKICVEVEGFNYAKRRQSIFLINIFLQLFSFIDRALAGIVSFNGAIEGQLSQSPEFVDSV